jgi:hypothetical protein
MIGSAVARADRRELSDAGSRDAPARFISLGFRVS